MSGSSDVVFVSTSICADVYVLVKSEAKEQPTNAAVLTRRLLYSIIIYIFPAEQMAFNSNPINSCKIRVRTVVRAANLIISRITRR